MNLSKVKFTFYLSIFSILGFATILTQLLTSVDIGVYVDSMLFLLIGFALMVSGGYQLIFSYFKNGLTVSEVNKIVSVVVGAISMFVGVLTIPIIGMNVEVFVGTKIIISIIAILVIIGEMVMPSKCGWIKMKKMIMMILMLLVLVVSVSARGDYEEVGIDYDGEDILLKNLISLDGLILVQIDLSNDFDHYLKYFNK